MVACLRAVEALYSCIISGNNTTILYNTTIYYITGNNTTIQCLARVQAGNHNIGLPMDLAEYKTTVTLKINILIF